MKNPSEKKNIHRRIIGIFLILCLLAGLVACSNPVSRAVDQNERKTVTHFYYVDDKNDQYAFPSEKVIDGKQYQLEKTRYKTVRENKLPVTSQSILLGKPDVYSVGGIIAVKGKKYQITKVNQIPKDLTWLKVYETSKEIEETVDRDYQDEDLNQETTVTYRLAEIKDNKDSWKDAKNGFKINIIGYGGPYYQIGNFRLSAKSTLKDVKKKQAKILDAQGLDPENSRITTATWDGSSYEDEHGNVCRDILVKYQTRMPGFTVQYQGTVYRYDLSYVPVTNMANRYYMEGIATYVLTNRSATRSLRTAMWIVLGLAILVGIVWLILYLHRKKTQSVVAGKGYSPDDF